VYVPGWANVHVPLQWALPSPTGTPLAHVGLTALVQTIPCSTVVELFANVTDAPETIVVCWGDHANVS